MEKTESNQNASGAFSRLFEVLQTLRASGGCPWDLDQTPLSMRRDLMEESFEAIDAITEGKNSHAKEELGDAVFNILLIAYMYEQAGDFTVAELFDEITQKLVRRHPHVFKRDDSNLTQDEVLSQWDKIKDDVEKRKKDSVLDQIPQGFPPLLKAYKMLSKAAKSHFDWPSVDEAKSKVREEFAEIEEAEKSVDAGKKSPDEKPFTVKSSNAELDAAQLNLEEEFGDFLLASVNWARMRKIDPTIALERACRKFYKRFTFVEKSMKESGFEMSGENLSKMEDFWQKAKECHL